MSDLDGWSRAPDEPLTANDRADERVRILQAAARSLTRVKIDYHKSNGEFCSGRPIRPRRVFRKAGHVYCEAHCELRGEIRHFRVDRISYFREEASVSPAPMAKHSSLPEVVRRESTGCLLYVILAVGLLCLIVFR
jgi:predicted DNA-binding transcriptional regulator YafY